MPIDSKGWDVFDKIFSEDIVQFLVDSNNKYGEVLRNNAFGKTIIRSFTEIDIQAIRTYFFKSAATINKGSPISPFFFSTNSLYCHPCLLHLHLFWLSCPLRHSLEKQTTYTSWLETRTKFPSMQAMLHIQHDKANLLPTQILCWQPNVMHIVIWEFAYNLSYWSKWDFIVLVVLCYSKNKSLS